jgi:hypothetical protein
LTHPCPLTMMRTRGKSNFLSLMRCFMTIERNRIGWGFCLWWVLVSTVGWPVGFIMGFVVATIIVEPSMAGSGALGEALGYFMFGALLGSVVSLMQWLVLWLHVSRAGWWILAGTAGFAVAFGAPRAAEGAIEAFGYSEVFDELGSFAPVLGLTLTVALGGAVTGILQMLVLRARVFRAGWWVLASAVGWGLGMAAVGSGLWMEEVWDSGALFLSLAVVGGVVMGAVTGGALVWLLRQPVPEV